MGNKIGSAPALLEERLQDFAQFWHEIDYSDIARFGERPEDWDKAYELIIKLDKEGFFERLTNEDPTVFSSYNELIKLVKNK